MTGWIGVRRWVAARASGFGGTSLSLLLSVVVAGVMFGANCGAPEEVMRVQVHPTGGNVGSSSGGEISSSGNYGTAGVAGSTASTLPAGGSVGLGSAGSSGGTGGTGRTGGTSMGGTTGVTTGGIGISTSPFGGMSIGGTTGGASSSGTGGTGGASGSAGSTSAPPPTNGLAVWVAKKTTGGTGQITLDLRIDNKSSQSVDMSAVTLRYWYQDEGLGTALVLQTNYVSIGYSNQGKVTSGIAVANPSPVPGADHYLELAFSGTLAPQGDPATNDQFNIQVTLHTANYQGVVDVTNDYSYDNGAEGVYEQKITLYDNGKLIWGVEPGTSSVIPSDAGVDASVSSGDSTDAAAEQAELADDAK